MFLKGFPDFNFLIIYQFCLFYGVKEILHHSKVSRLIIDYDTQLNKIVTSFTYLNNLCKKTAGK